MCQLGLPIGVKHVTVQSHISVVGADRIPVVSGVDRAMFGYFASKLAAERVVVDSGLPWTILRATQFHDAILTVARAMAKLPVVPAPAGFRFQPVDADEVAARLVQLTLGEPVGQVPDLGGPRAYTMADLLHGYLHANHRRRLIIPVWRQPDSRPRRRYPDLGGVPGRSSEFVKRQQVSPALAADKKLRSTPSTQAVDSLQASVFGTTAWDTALGKTRAPPGRSFPDSSQKYAIHASLLTASLHTEGAVITYQ